MAQFSIITSAAWLQVGTQGNYKNTLTSYEAEIRSIANQLTKSMSSASGIRNRLLVTADRVDRHKKSMGSMQNALENTLQHYEKTEQRIKIHASVKVGTVSNIVTAVAGVVQNSKSTVKWGKADAGAFATGKTVTKKEKVKPDWKKLGFDIVGSFGGGGKYMSSVLKVATGDKTKPSTWGGALKDIIKAVDKTKSALKVKGPVSAKWKNFLGLDKYTKTPSEAFKDGFKAMNVAASFASSIFSNFEEYGKGGMSKGRFAAETLLETGIDVAKTAVVSSGVTAAFGLIGVAAPPAAAVAVVTAGVVWGADYLSKKYLGKGVNEFISDTIIDGAIDKAKTVYKNAKAVTKVAKTAWKSVTTKWKHVFA